ncbi:hypothetical protein TNCV_2592651 [Trichonephila clavipes]|nr:hypothetical protein TNCV_2592651 [Trichonephila clavipes]
MAQLSPTKVIRAKGVDSPRSEPKAVPTLLTTGFEILYLGQVMKRTSEQTTLSPYFHTIPMTGRLSLYRFNVKQPLLQNIARPRPGVG